MTSATLDLLAQLRPILVRQPQPIYLVGGAVRDILLNHNGNDLDFAVPSKAIKTTYSIADALGQPAYVLDRERDVARIVMPSKMTIDIAGFRAGAGGDRSLEADLRDRDFTINAIALEVTTSEQAYIDPTNGIADIQNGIVRMTHPQAISDDPARALRAIRMAQMFGFVIEPQTEAAIRALDGRLDTISAERVRDELLKLLALPHPERAIRQLNEFGLLASIAPELIATIGVTQSPPHYEDVFDHSMSVLGKVSVLTSPGQREIELPYAAQLQTHLARPIDSANSAADLLRVAALFHDCGKPATRTVEPNGRIRFFKHEHVGAAIAGSRLRQLKFSGAADSYVKTIIKNHMRPLQLVNIGTPSRRSIFRYFKATGAAGLDIGIHALGDQLSHDNSAETMAKYYVFLNTLCQHYFDAYEETIQPPRLLDGKDLIGELNVPQGEEIGRILDAITELQATGEIKTREQAITLARKLNNQRNKTSKHKKRKDAPSEEHPS